MANRRVAIYEEVQRNGNPKPGLVPVTVPTRRPTTGGLYLKDDRRGAFYISWYEGKRKRFKKVKGDSLGLAPVSTRGKGLGASASRAGERGSPRR